MTADLRNCRHLIEDYLKMNLCGVNSAGIKLSSSYVIHMDSKLSKTSSLNAKGGKTLGFSTILFSIFENTKKASGTTIKKKIRFSYRVAGTYLPCGMGLDFSIISYGTPPSRSAHV